MKNIARVILVTALACGSGCARPDWIERTLVTVDVTGVWSGTATGNLQVELELRQEGPRVTGFVRAKTLTPSGQTESGPIDGSVSGDVFTFKQTNGSARGQLSVAGDEMAGVVSAGNLTAGAVSRPSGWMVLGATAAPGITPEGDEPPF
jgi:hypothetical protein